MKRSLRARVERLENEYLASETDEEDLDPELIVRRMYFVVRLAQNGDEQALALLKSLGVNAVRPKSEMNNDSAL